MKKNAFILVFLLLLSFDSNAQLTLPDGFKPYLIDGRSVGFNEDLDGDKILDKFVLLQDKNTNLVYISYFLSKNNFKFEKVYISFNIYKMYLEYNNVFFEIGNGSRYLAKLNFKYNKNFNKFELIGFDDEKLPDNNQNFENKSFNFLTKKFEKNINGKISKGKFKFKKVFLKDLNDKVISDIQDL